MTLTSIPSPSSPSRWAVVSTTSFPAEDAVTLARSESALRGIENARAQGAAVYLVDSESSASFVAKARAAGAKVARQRGATLGAARREVIQWAVEQGESVLIYSEVEKEELFHALPELCAPIESGDADMVLPARASLGSYPEFQRLTEELLNQYFLDLTGISLDVTFGPRVWRRDLSGLFLSYDGAYGDRWDSIYVPLLRAIGAGCRVVSKTIPFTYPHAQRISEEQDLGIRCKRFDQLASVAFAIRDEWRALCARRDQARAAN